MNPAFAINWYTFEKVCEIMHCSPRTLRTKVSRLSSSVVREEPGDVGRPRKLYHAMAFPQLAAWHALNVGKPDQGLDEESLQEMSRETALAIARPAAAPAADDLTIAQLRLMAIQEFEAAAAVVGKEMAYKMVSNKWAKHPQIRHCAAVERLSGWDRKSSKAVCVGHFSDRTLRAWVALYKERKSAGDSEASILLALAPRRKGLVGRKRAPIPEGQIEFVESLAMATVRADMAKAVETARSHLPVELQNISLSTWRRRLIERDPRKAGKDLMHSISRYRARHTPDVEIDWEQLPYNGRWELDDVQQDWLAIGTELNTAIRPYGYAIIRVRTRQWVAFAASETKPTQAQVRELVGFAMAQPGGGIPDVMKFERGTVACDSDLEHLLTLLGCKVSRTSMDGGAAVTGMVEDVASGHFQGKAIVEANFRRMHGLHWSKAGQVGGDERNTAPARTEKLKALAVKAAATGGFLMLPGPEQWPLAFLEAMETHNNKPHSGLPKILDPSTGKPRHMTPNEMATHLGDHAVRVMDARLLPRFAAKAERIPVTRNGCRLNNHDYGRFDEALQAFKEVTLFASRDYPAIAYCQELGRTLEAYVKASPGDQDQFAAKRHLEQRFRNQHEALQARAIQSGNPALLDILLAARNPTPARKILETVAPAELIKPTQELEAAIAAHKGQQRKADERFELASQNGNASTGDSSTLGTGLLARADELADQVDMLKDESEL